MAADLSLHMYQNLTEDDLSDFFSNTFGSKYFHPRSAGDRRWDVALEKVSNTPSIHIGEVSWLKAAVFEDDSFIPAPVQAVNRLIGEDLPVLDVTLRDALLAALRLPNTTGYDVADPDEVRTFLDAHMGDRLFTVSW